MVPAPAKPTNKTKPAAIAIWSVEYFITFSAGVVVVVVRVVVAVVVVGGTVAKKSWMSGKETHVTATTVSPPTAAASASLTSSSGKAGNCACIPRASDSTWLAVPSRVTMEYQASTAPALRRRAAPSGSAAASCRRLARSSVTSTPPGGAPVKFWRPIATRPADRPVMMKTSGDSTVKRMRPLTSTRISESGGARVPFASAVAAQVGSEPSKDSRAINSKPLLSRWRTQQATSKNEAKATTPKEAPRLG
mmetsp:Transcript_3057/g.9294  ORF Transcript_3057/g.9294 Transcript_3057/m.9294 type:complete len:249 (+) Transcript_3057:142-888(+)